MKEKDVVLAFARALRDRLRKTGRYRVVMTRDSDRFLTLRERVRISRAHDAQLFISIHADKFRHRTVRGATVYTLSEKASDREAAELARKENAADIIDGVDLGAGNDEVKGILIDLTMRETKNHSMFFAKKLVREMRQATRMHKRPIRSAGFRVLKAPDVPSVLIELGYVSNARDVRNLSSPRWREKITTAMARAVQRYFDRRIAANY